MYRKKQSAPSSSRRKAKKKSPSELKINIILLAIIFGTGIMLLAGRFLFVLPEITTKTAPEKVENIPEKTVQQKKPVKTAPVTTQPAEQPAHNATEKTPKVQPAPQQPQAQKPPVEKPRPPKKNKTLVFVFDDAGHNLSQLAPFLDLPFPCTIAVLPGLRYSTESARRIRKSGKDCILHQPMQAVNLSMDPGPGAILQGMGAQEIRAIVSANLDEVGPVTGMNNHEGSLITADPMAMSTVLNVIQERGLYFLDSRTTAKTAVPALAREKNITILERAVFLDNSQDKNLIMEAVYSGMNIANNNGSAVMIGHVWSNDLAEILTEMYPELISQGFSLSTIAKLAVMGDGDE